MALIRHSPAWRRGRRTLTDQGRGRHLSAGHSIDGIIDEKGYKQGKWKEFYETGELKAEGIYKNTEYISAENEDSRVILHYEIPLSTVLTDFYDKIKSVSAGYASINYEYLDYRPADVIKLDILVAEDIIESLATIVYRDDAYHEGREIVEILKKNLSKQMFAVKIQAAIAGKVIASETISAMRKDVTAKLYGGDVTRKRKLLEKQKKGKKKMMAAGKGSVDIPADTFVKILKR